MATDFVAGKKFILFPIPFWYFGRWNKTRRHFIPTPAARSRQPALHRERFWTCREGGLGGCTVTSKWNKFEQARGGDGGQGPVQGPCSHVNRQSWQSHRTENITFPQLRWRSVMSKNWREQFDNRCSITQMLLEMKHCVVFRLICEVYFGNRYCWQLFHKNRCIWINQLEFLVAPLLFSV